MQTITYANIDKNNLRHKNIGYTDVRASYREKHSLCVAVSSMTLTKHTFYTAVMKWHDTAADKWWWSLAHAAPSTHCSACCTIQQSRLCIHQNVREQEECTLIHSANAAVFRHLHCSNNKTAGIIKFIHVYSDNLFLSSQCRKSPTCNICPLLVKYMLNVWSNCEKKQFNTYQSL